MYSSGEREREIESVELKGKGQSVAAAIAGRPPLSPPPPREEGGGGGGGGGGGNHLVRNGRKGEREREKKKILIAFVVVVVCLNAISLICAIFFSPFPSSVPSQRIFTSSGAEFDIL